MKKSTKSGLLFVVIVLVLVLVGMFVVKNKLKEKDKVKFSDEEIKNILTAEQKFLDAEHMHVEYLDYLEYKEEPLRIDWVEKTKKISVDGEDIEVFELEDDNDKTFALDNEGFIYYLTDNGYTIEKADALKIGLFYPNTGGTDNCSDLGRAVVETKDGIHEILVSEDKVEISKDVVANSKYEIPKCYGKDGKFNDSYIYVQKGKIGYKQTLIKDKITRKEIDVKLIIYVVVGEMEKYYVIANDDTLYIVIEPVEYIEAIAKMDNIKIDASLDSNIKLTYKDISLSFYDVRNDAKYIG